MQRRTERSDAATLTIAGIEVTHPEKMLFPAIGVTKAGVAEYYLKAAPQMLPFLAGRPLTLTRYPEGIRNKRFFEKDAPDATPDWVETAVVVAETTGRKVRHIVASRAETLVWLANLAAIEIHIPLSRSISLDRPDFAFFDIDPEPPAGFAEAAACALVLHQILADLGLEGFVKTSGKKGIHVIVPLAPGHTFLQTQAFVHAIGRRLAREQEGIVSEFSASRIPGTLFIDYLQNSKGKTLVSPFSLRSTEHATVSTPIRWDEVRAGVVPTEFTITTVLERANPWEGILDKGQRLPEGEWSDPAGRQRMEAGSSGERILEKRVDTSPAGSPAVSGGTLAEYQEKRDFTRTTEPAVTTPKPGTDDRFVVHEHHARQLHYDLRLERGGVLRSWAVPKGIPLSPGIRHLAIQTEDHPQEYATFEGTIPEGAYGAGTVEIWDAGHYETIAWEPRKIEIVFHGTRLMGRYVMIPFQKAGPGEWLLFKAAK